MFNAKLFKEKQLLLIQHYDEFVGAESANAMLDVMSGFSREEKDIEKFKFVVFDILRITSISLDHTDGAMTAYFERILQNLIREKGGIPETLFRKIQVMYILPEELGCREVYLERVRRGVSAESLDISYQFVESTAEVLRETGLESLPDFPNGV